MQDEDDVPGVQPQDDAAPPEDTNEPEAEAEEAEDEGTAETEAEEPEGDTEDAESDDGEEAPQAKKGPSRSERYQRQIERLRQENAELRGRVTAVSDVKAEVDRIVGPPPKESDFGGDYTAYATALTAYETDKRITTRHVQAQVARDQSTRADRMAERVEAHRERIEDFRQVAPDFDDVMKGAAGVNVAPHVEDLILDSDYSAGVQYYLAKNPRAVDRLNQMTERQAAREFGRIEASLSQPSQRTQSRAPRPIRPLVGGAAAPSQEQRIDAYTRRRYGDRR